MEGKRGRRSEGGHGDGGGEGLVRYRGCKATLSLQGSSQEKGGGR